MKPEAEAICSHKDSWEDGLSRFCCDCGQEFEVYMLREGWIEGNSDGLVFTYDGWIYAEGVAE